MTTSKPKLTKAQRRVLEILAEVGERGVWLANHTYHYQAFDASYNQIRHYFVHRGVAKRLNDLGLAYITGFGAYITPAGREVLK